GLIFATHDLVPLTAVLLSFAVVQKHRWLAAVLADLAVAIVTWVITRPQGVPETYPPFGITSALILQTSLVLIFLFRSIGRFEVAQNAVAIGLLIWGSLAMGSSGQAALCLIVGLACYAYSWWRTSVTYGIYGLALVMTGISIFLSGLALIVAWCILA